MKMVVSYTFTVVEDILDSWISDNGFEQRRFQFANGGGSSNCGNNILSDLYDKYIKKGSTFFLGVLLWLLMITIIGCFCIVVYEGL